MNLQKGICNHAGALFSCTQPLGSKRATQGTKRPALGKRTANPKELNRLLTGTKRFIPKEGILFP